METQELTHDEESILLYLETCLVDGMGRVVGIRLNEIDVSIIAGMKERGLIDFGRLPFNVVEEIEKNHPLKFATHWVRFTDEAWKLAHKHRRMRSERMIATLGDR